MFLVYKVRNAVMVKGLGLGFVLEFRVRIRVNVLGFGFRVTFFKSCFFLKAHLFIKFRFLK